MKIADILRHKGTDVVTIAPTDTVATLLATLAEHNLGALLAVEGSTVVGIVSERDVVRAAARDGAVVFEHTVDTIMTSSVVGCAGDDDVAGIAATMTERRIRHMPVLDGGSLVGIVSIGDVVSSQIRQLEHEREHLEQYISS